LRTLFLKINAPKQKSDVPVRNGRPEAAREIDIPALRFQIDQDRAVICLSAALVT
jgi:hypothetical protein